MKKAWSMKLIFSDTILIGDLQAAFNREYPYLKLRFYRDAEASLARKGISESSTLKQAGLIKVGSVAVHDEMTVGELEQKLRKDFGLTAQVSRRSGRVWLETTMTDGWTLRQQNEHGRELSV